MHIQNELPHDLVSCRDVWAEGNAIRARIMIASKYNYSALIAIECTYLFSGGGMIYDLNGALLELIEF